MAEPLWRRRFGTPTWGGVLRGTGAIALAVVAGRLPKFLVAASAALTLIGLRNRRTSASAITDFVPTH